MKTKIYVDILLSLNLLLNFLLLYVTVRLCRAPLHRGRLILSAFAGALYSLIILIPEISPWMLASSKLLMCLVMMRIAIPWRGGMFLFKDCCLFFGVNFLFAGAMMAVWLFLKPDRMFFCHGVVYLHLSAPALILATVLAYLCSELVFFLLRHRPTMEIKNVRLCYHGTCLSLRGFMDTGNILEDPFTGKPVVIACMDAISSLLSMEELAFLAHPVETMPPDGFRMIPCHTVNECSILPVFTPDALLLEEKQGFLPVGPVLVGVSMQDTFANSCSLLLNPRLSPTSAKQAPERMKI